ncbi:MAG: ATP-binding cassette domain-containing protein [Actinomycetota bacterium]
MISVGGFDIAFEGVVLGAIVGMTYGILSVGLTLIYRASKVINFAYGETGAFGAAILAISVARWHFPYWLGFLAALLAGAALSAGLELTIVRRLRNAPKLMTVIATLGAGSFIVLVALALVGQELLAAGAFPQPQALPQFNVGFLRVTPAYSGMLFLTPLVVISLTLFLRRTRYGLAIRAAAANANAARLVGLSASRMGTLAWALAGAVSAFTALLVLPARGLFTPETFGAGLLVRALLGAVVARMTSLPLAFAAGIVLGIIEVLVGLNSTSAGLVEMVLFVIIVCALLFQTRRGGREEDKGTWSAVHPWPPLPERYAGLWSVRHFGHFVAVAGLAAGLAIPFLFTNRIAIIFVSIAAFSIVGLSVGVITGLSGQLSFGQFALAGLGATVSYLISSRTGNFALSLFFAGLTAAVVSAVVGLPALRIKGFMLAVTTLAFAVATHLWLLQQPWMLAGGKNPGRPILGSLVLDTAKRYYFFALFFLVVSMWLYRNVRSGGFGRSLVALRDNEAGARAFTVPVTLRKLQAFGVAGFLAGLGGAIYGHSLASIGYQVFAPSESIKVVAMAVIGGIGILAGPLLGALYIIAIPAFLPLDSAGLAATSLGWLLFIVYFPGGIAQVLRPVRDGIVARLAKWSGLAQEDSGRESGADTLRTSPRRGKLPSFLGGRARKDREERIDWSRPPKIAVVQDGRRIDRMEWDEVRSGSDRGTQKAEILEVEGVSKSFGGVHAVRSVTLSVKRGETLGLIGPNGAGKTTLFELISGFTKPDEGEVTFNGRPIGYFSPEERGRLGLIRSFQDAELFETMTVLDVALLATERAQPTRLLASLVGARRLERQKQDRAVQLVTRMGLEEFRRKQISELSTGTRRITELMCILAMEPELILLDEPSSGIAQRETEALGELLRRVKKQLDATLVIIEHDIPLIMSLSDRVLAMESGRIIAEGTPQEIRKDSRVVDSYLGTNVTAIERSQATVATG